MTKLLTSGYRPDIQGLRAIAVMLVILAHAGIPWVVGGFVGVDVFFVLSGFLITGQLLQEYKSAGRLSLGKFYLRRLRRLLPALVVVIGATAVVVGWLFSKSDGRLILSSLPFAVSWTSNLFFVLREQNYFNDFGEKDVLLHTWSLGVEEQFYLLWPVLLLGLMAAARILTLRSSFLLLVFLSFFVSVVWTYLNPISAFYMMPARIWQFGLGGLIYLYTVSWRDCDYSVSVKAANNIAFLGLALIFAAALFLDKQTLYPGYWASLPSLGTALVILAGSLRKVQKPAAASVLTYPPLVWLGDRSYSLYLWHYPVIVIFGLMGLEVSNEYSTLWLALFLTLLLAMVSYRWIELPFWKMSLKTVPPRTFVLGSGTAVLLVLAVSFHVQRIPPGAVEPSFDLVESIRLDAPVIYQMSCDAWYQHAKVEPCVIGPKDAPNTAVLLADSIGAQWFSAWAHIFNAPQWRFVVLTKSSCPIVDEDYFYSTIGKVYDVCRQWRESVLKQIGNFAPRVIVVGSSSGYKFSDEQWVEGSRRVLERLSAVAERVVVVSGSPGLGFDGPSCIARHLHTGNTLATIDCSSEGTTEKTDHVSELLSTAARDFSNVQVFNPVELVCPKGKCRALLPTGVAVFRDDHHLTDTYVRSIAEQLRSQLNIDISAK